MTDSSLAGRVALVTGATRGAGRGIAIELGAAGATVYCTGRTSGAHRSPFNRPETIEETAQLVTEAGGTGIAVQVDHRQIDQVSELVARIDAEQDNWQDWYWNDPEHNPAGWLSSETPRYTVRAVVALATDPEVARWNGQAVKTDWLAGEYGFTDVNGTQPGHGIYDWRLLGEHPPRRADYQ